MSRGTFPGEPGDSSKTGQAGGKGQGGGKSRRRRRISRRRQEGDELEEAGVGSERLHLLLVFLSCRLVQYLVKEALH